MGFPSSSVSFSMFTLTLALVISGSSGFFHQPSFVAPVYDEYGNEITTDNILEMTAMKSTALGYGQGWNYSAVSSFTPFTPPMVPPYIVIPGFPGQSGPVRFSQDQSSQYSVRQNPYAPARSQTPAPTYRISQSGTYNRPVYSYNTPANSYNPSANSYNPSANSYNTPTNTYNRPTNLTPFHHRRFKRQAGFPSGSGNSLLDNLARAPADFEFGPNSDFGPSGGDSFITDPFASDPFTSGGFPDPSQTFPSQNQQTETQQTACQPEQEISCNAASRYRTVDGLCNNLANPKWGAAKQRVVRMHKNYYYYDGIDVPRMTSASDPRRLLPSPRLVSRLIHEPDRPGHEIPELTNLIQQWGQFLDHDLTGTPAHKGPDGKDLKCCDNVYLSEERQIHNDVFNGGPCNPIYIPPLDRHFSESCMSFARSQAAPRRSDCDPRATKEPREQMNMITAYIDASQVYGSSLKDNRKIRLYSKGMLRVTNLNLLPEDVNSTCVKERSNDYCFLAGEMRVNEHPALASMHTIFHRFHNIMATEMSQINPNWGDEKIFQEVRKIMGAIMQHVTYHDWLPIILGPDVMQEFGLFSSSPFDGLQTTGSFWYYDSGMNPTIMNEFATAAFRFGHTLIPSTFSVAGEKIRLHRMFNRPSFVLRDNGQSISGFCSGLMEDSIQHCDRFVSTDLTDRLFEDKNNISMDLAALNIQRARDHGLPGYNEYRELCGLKRIQSFDDLYRDDPDRAEVFRRVYDHVDDIDLFTGGISEKPLAGAIVGRTFACILGKQFRSLKFGDRFWYESGDQTLAFTAEQLQEIRSFSLSKVLCTTAPLEQVTANPFFRNGAFLPKPVRLANGQMVTQNQYVDCQMMKNINLQMWADQGASGKK